MQPFTYELGPQALHQILAITPRYLISKIQTESMYGFFQVPENVHQVLNKMVPLIVNPYILDQKQLTYQNVVEDLDANGLHGHVQRTYEQWSWDTGTFLTPADVSALKFMYMQLIHACLYDICIAVQPYKPHDPLMVNHLSLDITRSTGTLHVISVSTYYRTKASLELSFAGAI